MADVFGVQSTKAYTGDPQDKAPVEFAGGDVRAVMDEFEASSLASGSAIRMGKIPAAAVLNAGRVDHDAMGASVTLAVHLVPLSGAADVVIAAATAADTAGTINIDDIDDALQLVLDETHFLEVVTGGATATGTIKIQQYYVARA